MVKNIKVKGITDRERNLMFKLVSKMNKEQAERLKNILKDIRKVDCRREEGHLVRLT